MKESMRITDHPILGKDESVKKVTIYYEGTPVEANEGEPIAVALANAGIRTLHITEKFGHPSGIFCGQGRCGSCRMIVDGVPDVKTCSTPVKDGMKVQVQHGLA